MENRNIFQEFNNYVNQEQRQNNNKKRKYMFIAGPLILLIALVGVTYAFFNYTRTGVANSIRTGNIYFNSSQNGVLNLTNVFPVASSEIDNADSVTIQIQGDTTYSDGEEFLISLVNVNNTIGSGSNEKVIPITYSATYVATPVATGETANSIGTSSSSYFTARNSKNANIYLLNSTGLVEENIKVLIGYIKSGETGINGTLTIKAYIDSSSIAISDTYPSGDVTHAETSGETSNEVLDYTNGTTNEWVNGRTVLTTSEWNSLQNTPISFKVKAESNEGIWVDDPSALGTIKKNVITPTNPINFAEISSSSNGEGLYILPGTENDTNPIYYYRGNINNNNVIFGDYCWQIVRTTNTGGIKMIYNGAVTGNGQTCENTVHADRIISSSPFNIDYESMSDVGYMSNTRYPHSRYSWTTDALFASDATWITDHYELTDASVTAPDTTHHYSCNATTANATCTSLRYVYYVNGTAKYYITLTNGEALEDAIYKMTGNGDATVVARNSGYNLNVNNSAAKTAIDNWFRTNLTSEVDANNPDYSVYLEDTVYCNDRSYKTVVGNTSYPTFEQSGWNKNGGDLTKHLYFGSVNRALNNWYSTTNVPSVACPNETDRFTVSNTIGNGALTYPVGLLTTDEIVMTGAGGNGANNSSYYLYTGTGDSSWSLSPGSFNGNTASQFNSTGKLNHVSVVNSFGLRPVISLKSGVEFETGGEGTPTNPYVVKYN